MEQLRQVVRDIAWRDWLSGAFIVLLLIACVIVAARLGTQSHFVSPISPLGASYVTETPMLIDTPVLPALTATPGPMLPMAHLPFVIREYPPTLTPTITPIPTWTATPWPTPQPGHSEITIQVDRQSSNVGNGLEAMLWVYDDRPVEVVESCVWFNPVVLRVARVTRLDTSELLWACKIRINQPGALCYDCELSIPAVLVEPVFGLLFVAMEPGPAYIQARSFVGYENGFGVTRSSQPVTITVTR